MTFCQACGNKSAASAAFCVSCGTRVAAPLESQQSVSTPSTAPTEDISKSWKEKFSIIEKAGGVKLPKNRELTFRERSKAIFNVWGWFFGPFYYLTKGMWKKAIVFTALCIAAIVVLEAIFESMGISTTLTNFIGPAVFGTRANIDYYKKIILGDNGWW